MTTRSTTPKRESALWPPIEYEDPRETKGYAPLDMLQSSSFFKIMPTLAAYFSDDPTVYVNGLFPVRDNPRNLRDCLWPDGCVAFGVNREAILRETGYHIWQVGKPPDFILEIASESTAYRDSSIKLERYAGMGAPEYWLFDPSGGDHYGSTLLGFRLVNGEYEPIDLGVNEDGLLYGHSSVIGLNICVVEDGEVVGRYLPQLQEPVSGRYLRYLIDSGKDLSGERRARIAAEAEVAELRERLRRQGE